MLSFGEAVLFLVLVTIVIVCLMEIGEKVRRICFLLEREDKRRAKLMKDMGFNKF